MPKWNPISISGYHIREAGSTAAQEIAFTLADGIAYVDAALKAGLEVDAFAGRLSFFFNVHNNFLEEVAKFRAARRLWARIMKERFKAKDPRSMMLRFHAQTAGSTLTAQQPDNNVVRVALQALAAVLGGSQSLHTNSRDEALALPTEEAARLALRTQQIIAHESGVADIIDPLGGSYAHRAADRRARGQGRGLHPPHRRHGRHGARPSRRASRRRRSRTPPTRPSATSEEKRQVVVGVNQFQVKEPPPTGLLRVDEAVEHAQVERLTKLRRRARQRRGATRTVDTLRKAARETRTRTSSRSSSTR